MIVKKTFLLFLFISLILIWGIRGPDAQSEAQAAVNPEITGIDIREVNNTTEIKIDGNAPFTYTIYKPSDPYKVVVELQGVDIGIFKDKMVFDKAGVMEIIPSKVEGAANIARLEIALAVPTEVKSIQKGNSLVLAFVNSEAEETTVAEKEEAAEETAVTETSDAEIIDNIEFSKSDDKIRVIISGDGKMNTNVFQLKNNRLVVDIPNVSTTISAPRTFEPPVADLRIGKYPDKTRVVFDLTGPAEYDVSTEGKQVIVSFKKPVAIRMSAKTEAPVIKKPLATPKTAEKPFVSGKYVGEEISIDFQDADLLHVFRLIATISGYNIVVSPQVKGTFSMKLLNVPWDQALDIILRNYGLAKIVQGNIIRIAPRSLIVQEEEEIAKVKESQEKAGKLETRVYAINYADVAQIKSAINTAKILTKRGFISVDKRTSSVIIKDVEKKHIEYENLIKALDVPTRQVNIEARIVEVTTNFAKEFGIQWGGTVSPTPQMQVSGAGLTGGTGSFGSSPLLVNLPAAVGSGAGGGIGFGLISARQLRSLDIQLSAMESTGEGKIISNPRITTLDNEKATIQQGKKIPYQSAAEGGGTKTSFVDAALELTVTPHITPEGTIAMDVQVKKNEADFSQTAAGGAPTIDTKEATTKVLVKDSDTIVIGGIFKTTKSQSLAGVPALSKIPFLGWLFKTKRDRTDTSELLIFITPRIVK